MSTQIAQPKDSKIVHPDVKRTITRRLDFFPEVKIVGFGVSSLTSFPMDITTPTLEQWQAAAADLAEIGLNAEITGSFKTKPKHPLAFRVEVHVPINWEVGRISTAKNARA